MVNAILAMVSMSGVLFCIYFMVMWFLKTKYILPPDQASPSQVSPETVSEVESRRTDVSVRVEVGSEAAVQIDIGPKVELVTEDTRVVPEDDWSDF